MTGLTPSITGAEPAAFTLAEASRGAGSRLASPGGASFASQLTAAAGKGGELQEAGDQLVATAFVLPMLEAMRNDPFKSELFHGGRGEDVFGQQLDVILAERITSSANFGIADAVTRQFSRNASPTDSTQAPRIDTRG